MKHVYKVTYAVTMSLHRNGKPVGEVNEWDECMIFVAGSSDVVDVIGKIRKIALHKQKPIQDTDDDGRNIKGHWWRPDGVRIISVEYQHEVYL